MASDLDQAVEILRIVDEELLPDRQHWAKGMFSAEQGDGTFAYCLGAARRRAGILLGYPSHRASPPSSLALNYLLGAIRLEFPQSWVEVDFNDDPETTFEQVKLVIARARESAARDQLDARQREEET